jgi:Tol biopolymer transport system component
MLVAACGSDPKAPDAMPDAAPRCDPSAPFAAPVPVEGVNSHLEEAAPRLSPDELTIYFSRKQTTAVYDLYQATRDSRDAAFGTPELLATVNSINSDVWGSVSPDGLTLIFDSDRGMPNTYRSHISKRASTADRFGPAVAVAGLLAGDVHPMIANNSVLYFASPNATRMGAGVFDIFRTTLDTDGTVGMVTPVIGGVNTADLEMTPALTEDELHIYFRRDVANEADIYTASRSTVNDGFGLATKVETLAVPLVSENPGWISADGCNLYSYSNASGGMGLTDIHVSRRGSP